MAEVQRLKAEKSNHLSCDISTWTPQKGIDMNPLTPQINLSRSENGPSPLPHSPPPQPWATAGARAHWRARLQVIRAVPPPTQCAQGGPDERTPRREGGTPHSPAQVNRYGSRPQAGSSAWARRAGPHRVSLERRKLLAPFGRRFWHACRGCGADISLHSLLARNAVLVNHDGRHFPRTSWPTSRRPPPSSPGASQACRSMSSGARRSRNSTSS